MTYDAKDWKDAKKASCSKQLHTKSPGPHFVRFHALLGASKNATRTKSSTLLMAKKRKKKTGNFSISFVFYMLTIQSFTKIKITISLSLISMLDRDSTAPVIITIQEAEEEMEYKRVMPRWMIARPAGDPNQRLALLAT